MDHHADGLHRSQPHCIPLVARCAAKLPSDLVGDLHDQDWATTQSRNDVCDFRLFIV